MIKIRLAKIGKKKDFTYRVVAIEHRSKNNGEALEVLGRWHPKSGLIEIDKKAVQAWVEKGAQMSESVASLMKGKAKPKKIKKKDVEEEKQADAPKETAAANDEVVAEQPEETTPEA